MSKKIFFECNPFPVGIKAYNKVRALEACWIAMRRILRLWSENQWPKNVIYGNGFETGSKSEKNGKKKTLSPALRTDGTAIRNN